MTLTTTSYKEIARHGLHHLKTYTVPLPYREMGIPTRIYGHPAFIAGILFPVLEDLMRQKQDLIATFDGCYNDRNIRGSLFAKSMHAAGAAVDLNAATNRMGSPSTQPELLVYLFEKHKAVWGAHFRRRDPMHWELSKEMLERWLAKGKTW